MAITPEEKSLLKHLDKFDEEGQAYLDSASENWDTFTDQFRGDQWPSGNPFFLGNMIGPTIDRKVALLTESKPTIFISPRRSGLAETSAVLKKTVDAGWDEYSMEMVLEDIAYYASILGAGYIKLPYVPSADYGYGDIVPSPVDPRAVRIDPWVKRAHQLNQGQFVVVDSIEPLWQLQRRFPGRGALVKQDSRFSPLEPGGDKLSWMTRAFAKSKTTGDQKSDAIPRGYVREYQFHDPMLKDDGEPRYPHGRHIIRGGDDVVLLDEPTPYWDGVWDVDLLDGKPDIDTAYGRSEVEALRRLQEAFNRTGNMFMQNLIYTGNAWIIADADAIDNDMINKITNAGGIVLTKRFGRELRREAAPPIPAHFLEFMRFCIQVNAMLAGLDEGNMQGKGRMEVRSGAQFEGLQLASQVLVRAMARRLEAFLQRLGQKWIARIFQFYTRDRMLTFLGQNNEFMSFNFERQRLIGEIVGQADRRVREAAAKAQPPHAVAEEELREAYQAALQNAWKDFSFKITPGSSLAATKIQRMMLFMQGAQAGFVSRKHAIREFGIDNVDEELAMAIKEAQQFGPLVQPKPGKKKTS